MRPIVCGRITLVFLFSILLIFHQNQPSKMLAQDETLTLIPSETPFPSALPTETAAETPTASPTETPQPTLTTNPVPGETPTASETPTDPSEIALTASPTDELTATPTLPELTFTVSPSEASSETATEAVSLTPGATATASLTDAFTETATASATQPALEAEPPLSLLFTDSFDTGSLALWNLGSGWSLTGHDDEQALQAVNSDEAVTFVYNTLNNAVVQTQFVMNTGMIRLSLRQSDAGAYTVILALNGRLALYRGNQVIGTAVAASPLANTWHTLRLSAINTLLRVSLDGQEVITTSDSTPLPAGTFSIAGINNTQSLLVDDVSLWIPTSDLPPTVTPTDTDVPTLMAAPAPFSLSMQSLAAILGNTQILFTAQREGNDNEIYSLDPTNCVATIDCPATQITFNVVNESYPVLSADSSKIAFVSNRAGNDELYVMDTNGNNIVRLTYNSDSITNPTWSPDGTKIAFVSQRDGTWKIYVLTRANCVSGADCTATVLSSTTTTGDFTPAWSPDGTKIAFYSRVASASNIWVMNADGTNKKQITDTTSSGITNDAPAWSPDGTWIAFDTTRYGSNTGVEIAKLNYASCTTPPSCAVTRLTTNSGDDEHPSWSPDGNLIAYSAQYGSTQRHLTIMNADGTNATRLTYSGLNNLYANWGVLNSAYPPDADRLFSDNFEQNDLKNWSTNSQTDFGDLGVSASAAILGNYGLLANLDDNASIYLLDGFATTKRLRMHFSFDPNTISMANGDAHYIVTGTTYTYQVEFRRFNNEYQIRAGIDNDTAGGWSNTNWFSITDAAHFIDFVWTAATAPGTNDGSLSLWIDNALQQTITGIDNDTRNTSLLYIGAVSGVDTNTRGTYYFDEVEVRKLNGSGGFIPTGTPTPTPTLTLTPTSTASFTPSLTVTPTETATFTLTPTPAFCPSNQTARRSISSASAACETMVNGVQAEYFNNTTLSDDALQIPEANIDYDWGYNSPQPSINADNFSVRWTGQIDIEQPGNWIFYVRSDDGIRLYIDGNLVLDKWVEQQALEFGVQIPNMTIGLHDFKLEYFDLTGIALVHLSWELPNQIPNELSLVPKAIIPEANLYMPEDQSTATATPTPTLALTSTLIPTATLTFTPTTAPEPFKVSIVNDGSRPWSTNELQAISMGVNQVGTAFDYLSAVANTPEAAFNLAMIENSGTEILMIRTQQTTSTISINYQYQYGIYEAQTTTLIYTNAAPGYCISAQEHTIPNTNTLIPASVICNGNLIDQYAGLQLTNEASQYTIVHELGHLFDYHTSYTSSSNPPKIVGGLSGPIDGSFVLKDCSRIDTVMGIYNNNWTRGRRGWGTGPAQYLNATGTAVPLVTDFQQDSLNDIIEVAADSFLNWVFRINSSSGVQAADSCSLTPPPPSNQWSGPGFLNVGWNAAPNPSFIANSAGLPGTPDPNLPGDSRYLDIDTRIRQIFTSHQW